MTESTGFVLSGSVLVVQGDMGQPQYPLQSGRGTMLCRRVCLRAVWNLLDNSRKYSASHARIAFLRLHLYVHLLTGILGAAVLGIGVGAAVCAVRAGVWRTRQQPSSTPRV